jgi:hypothetical protein
MDLLTSTIEHLNVNTSDLTPNLAQLQSILARFLPLDSLRGLSQAGIGLWNKSNTTNIVVWFKQSLTPGFEYLSSLVPSISKTGITPILTHLQNILDRFSPLDSPRGLSLAGINLWHKSNTANIVEWFKQSLTPGFEYLSSITLSVSKINITRYLSQGWEFLREIILGSPMHKIITPLKLTLPIGNLLAVWIVAFGTTMIALSRIGFGRVGITKGKLSC